MKIRIFAAIICYLLILGFFEIKVVSSVSSQELRGLIEAKSKDLLDINSQIQETQGSIKDLQSQQNSLKKEISSIDYNIRQLDLGMKSSEINIEKLGLEIESLNYDIEKVEKDQTAKKDGIVQILRELQVRDNETLLNIFLRNKSLAETVFETQQLIDLNSGLSVEVAELQRLQIVLNENLDKVSKTKAAQELENQNLKNRKVIVSDQKKERNDILRQTQNKEGLYQQQLKELEERQTEIAAEIEKVEEELRTKIDPSILPVPRPGVLAMPVNGVISQEYGQTAFARYGYKGKFHNGVDIAAPIGYPVFSAEKGKVIALGDQDKFCYRGAYGKFVVVEHENNLTTLYAHLSRINVSVGDELQRGDLIGYIGNTGYSTGPHLHFGVYASQTFYMGSSNVCGPMPFGGHLDPEKYL